MAEASAPGGAGQPADSGFPGFPYLLSLHALAVTDVELCMPSGNPAQFVQTLAPYLKAPAGAWVRSAAWASFCEAARGSVVPFQPVRPLARVL